jgi:SulP family sulfate permease
VALPLATALRACLREGYGPDRLRADLMAGLVVGVVALPLSMALAVASGVAPQHGLYTAVVAGLAIALLGGSRVQVSGPTAAFVVILAPIAARAGLGGLLMATLLAGLMLIAMGALGFGQFIEFVPHPVTTGFTSGIAVVIATLQLKDLLGLEAGPLPDHYLEKLGVLAGALHTTHLADLTIGLATLLTLLVWPRLSRRVPGPLVALFVGALGALFLDRAGMPAATIASRFEGGVPQRLPQLVWPWSLPGPDGAPLALSFGLFRGLLLPSAFAIAMLGAIESLLSAVVADGMTGTKHDPDAELVAQGVGNVIAPFFGGIAATGAIARTATSVRAGGRTPLASAVHALVVLASLLLLAPILSHLPMAALAALLVFVAWNMAEAPHFVRILRTAPRSDVTVLVLCFSLTVIFDMVVSVTVGVVISALLFMRRMAAVSGVSLVGSTHHTLRAPLPRSVVIYDVQGPLFFGAAQKAMGALETVEGGVRVVILDMTDVPAIDATGLVALESAIARLNADGVKVILAGVAGQPLRAFARAGWRNRKGRLRIFQSFERAAERAREYVRDPAPPPGLADTPPFPKGGTP